MSSVAGFGGPIFGEDGLGKTSSFLRVIARAACWRCRRAPDLPAPATLPERGGAGEAAQDRLRHHHPALAAGCRARRRLSYRAAHRDRSAGQGLAQRCSTSSCRGPACGRCISRRRSCWSACRSRTRSIWSARASAAACRLDKVAAARPVGRKQARLGAISVLLTWIFFGAMVTLIISGGMLYFGVFAGYSAAMVHWFAAWVVPAFAPACTS